MAEACLHHRLQGAQGIFPRPHGVSFASDSSSKSFVQIIDTLVCCHTCTVCTAVHCLHPEQVAHISCIVSTSLIISLTACLMDVQELLEASGHADNLASVLRCMASLTISDAQQLLGWLDASLPGVSFLSGTLLRCIVHVLGAAQQLTSLEEGAVVCLVAGITQFALHTRSFT